MLKGQSKIELFNARTGEKQAEYKNHNLITNAVSKILNMNDDLGLFNKQQYSSSAICAPNIINMAMPLCERAFAGVYLFNEAITESVNTVMPPDGTKCVGYAGSQYSGSDTFRGSRNMNESGYILDKNSNPIGYRHVWDFGTDKGNGTINCLGLTSQYGGDFGLKANLSGNTYFPFNSGHFSDANTYNALTYSSYYAQISTTHSLTAIYAAMESDGSILMLARSNASAKVYKIILEPTKSLSILKDSLKVRSETELISDLSGYQMNSVYVYNNLIHEVYRSASKTLTHKTYSLTGVLQNTVTVTTPSDCYDNAYTVPFYFNNHYYYQTATDAYNKQITKCNAAGELVSTIKVNVNYSYSYTGILSVFINEPLNQVEMFYGTNSASSNKQPHLVLLGADDTCNGVNTFTDNTSYQAFQYKSAIFGSGIDCFKYMSVNVSGSTQIRVLPLIDMRYLASINNLATPVVKTSAQVMKITYEITQQEDTE